MSICHITSRSFGREKHSAVRGVTRRSVQRLAPQRLIHRLAAVCLLAQFLNVRIKALILRLQHIRRWTGRGGARIAGRATESAQQRQNQAVIRDNEYSEGRKTGWRWNEERFHGRKAGQVPRFEIESGGTREW